MGELQGKDIGAGIILLIFIYLILSGGSTTTQIISSLSQAFTSGVSTLQGNSAGGLGGLGGGVFN